MRNDPSEDLIAEIFLRLPAKSLLRFRSLSKSLHACIDSPTFIRSHSLRSPKKTMIIHRITGHYPVYTLHSGFPLSDDPYNGISSIDCPSRYFQIIGSSNGIVCIYEYGAGNNIGVYLYNPSIRRKLAVPPCPLYYSVLDGFGFDPIIDDYKVLSITHQSSFVCTLKTQAWRQIAPPANQFLIVKSRQRVFNGALHWAVKKDLAGYYYILAFNLISEVFSMIQLPEPSWETTGVTVINGFLAVISSKDDHCRIRVRKEDNNATGSWSVALKLNSNPFEGAQIVFQITSKAELLICSCFVNWVEVYNPKTEVRSRLVNFDHSYNIVGVTTCIESLELLGMGTSCDKREADHQDDMKL